VTTDALVLLSTFPEKALAEETARTLVGEGLAACANVIPSVQSIYRWEGAVHENSEVLVIIKTTHPQWGALSSRLLELHPYDCPELIGLPVAEGHEPYLRWLAAAGGSE